MTPRCEQGGSILVANLLLCVVLLSNGIGSASANRVIRQTEDAYELVLGEVNLPGSVTSSIVFKACPECALTSLRVTSETIFFVNGAALGFPAFLEAAKRIQAMKGGNRNTAVYVFLDMESRWVTRLELDHLNG